MISLFGIFGLKMNQLVKSKHVAGEIPFQQIFQLRACQFSMALGLVATALGNICAICPRGLVAASHGCASVFGPSICGGTLERARDSCHKLEI